jgi:hypothetical protein
MEALKLDYAYAVKKVSSAHETQTGKITKIN